MCVFARSCESQINLAELENGTWKTMYCSHMEQKPIQFNQSVQYVYSIGGVPALRNKLRKGKKSTHTFRIVCQAQADAELLFDCKLSDFQTTWKHQTFRSSRDEKMKTKQTYVLMKSGQRNEYWRAELRAFASASYTTPLHWGRGQTLWGWVTDGTTQRRVTSPADCTYVGWQGEWAGKGQKQSVVVFYAF